MAAAETSHSIAKCGHCQELQPIITHTSPILFRNSTSITLHGRIDSMQIMCDFLAANVTIISVITKVCFIFLMQLFYSLNDINVLKFCLAILLSVSVISLFKVLRCSSSTRILNRLAFDTYTVSAFISDSIDFVTFFSSRHQVDLLGIRNVIILQFASCKNALPTE